MCTIPSIHYTCKTYILHVAVNSTIIFIPCTLYMVSCIVHVHVGAGTLVECVLEEVQTSSALKEKYEQQ